MSKSKVYFTNLRTKYGLSLLKKLENLVYKAGIEKIDFNNKFTAIKIHFGEPGNLAYIRPNYAAKIVNIVKSLQGKPFLTDANTLYSGKRSNALDHLTSAYENGFTPLVTGCNIIIADGLKGTEQKEVEINLEVCKIAKIAAAICDSDIIITMNHFKGHEMTGFGGALKNIGMGCASVSGKMDLHSNSKPKIIKKNCVGCGSCVKNCFYSAITLNSEKKAEIDYTKCIGCGQCIAVCQFNAANVVWDTTSTLINKKIAEYSYAVLKDKPHFHINFVMNVSPDCDCFNANDLPIVPDIGILASFDPVAIDQASVDLVNQAPIILGSKIDNENSKTNDDKFLCIHPMTDWAAGLDHAEKIGLGKRDYELIEI